MRKKFLAVALAATMAVSATAVGFADNVGENTDPGWWSAFSEYYTLSDGDDVTAEFTLHSKEVNNWDGWLLVFHTAGTERQGDGYSEYAVLRQDNFGWGGVVEGWWNDPAPEAILERETNIADWDAYKAALDGSNVTVNLTKEKSVVTVDAATVGTDDNVYTLHLKIDTGVSGDIGYFFTVDSAWMENLTIVDNNQQVADKPINVGENTDSGWWTVFSDYYTLSDGEDVTVEFTLHSKEVNNWDGWLLVFHTAGTERQGDGYSEYAVLRHDNFGWGGVVEGWWNDPAPEAILERETNIADWDAYKAALDGSKVAVKLTKEGTVVTVDATTVGTDDNTYTLYLKIDTGVSGEIGYFFTVDSAWLENFIITDNTQSGEPIDPIDPVDPEDSSEENGVSSGVSSSVSSGTSSDSGKIETAAGTDVTQGPSKVSIGDKAIVVDVSGENVPEGAKMNVAEVTDEVELEKVEKAIESKFAKEIKKYAVLDLNMMVGTEKVQPLNNGKVLITVDVPAALSTSKAIGVYRMEDDGTLTELKATVKDGKVSFETEHFSTYVIAEKVAAETESEPSSPKTGDTAPIALLLVAALSACGAVVVSKRRETR